MDGGMSDREWGMEQRELGNGQPMGAGWGRNVGKCDLQVHVLVDSRDRIHLEQVLDNPVCQRKAHAHFLVASHDEACRQRGLRSLPPSCWQDKRAPKRLSLAGMGNLSHHPDGVLCLRGGFSKAASEEWGGTQLFIRQKAPMRDLEARCKPRSWRHCFGTFSKDPRKRIVEHFADRTLRVVPLPHCHGTWPASIEKKLLQKSVHVFERRSGDS